MDDFHFPHMNSKNKKKISLGQLWVWSLIKRLMVCFLCFRNVAGWLPVDLPGVHVHSWPLSGTFGTISLLANTCTNIITLISFKPPHYPSLSPWPLSPIAVPAAGVRRRARTPSSGSVRCFSWCPTGAGFTRTSSRKRSTSGASWRYVTTRLHHLFCFSISPFTLSLSLILWCPFTWATKELQRTRSSSFVSLSCSKMGLFFLKFCTTGHLSCKVCLCVFHDCLVCCLTS